MHCMSLLTISQAHAHLFNSSTSLIIDRQLALCGQALDDLCAVDVAQQHPGVSACKAKKQKCVIGCTSQPPQRPCPAKLFGRLLSYLPGGAAEGCNSASASRRHTTIYNAMSVQAKCHYILLLEDSAGCRKTVSSSCMCALSRHTSSGSVFCLCLHEHSAVTHCIANFATCASEWQRSCAIVGTGWPLAACAGPGGLTAGTEVHGELPQPSVRAGRQQHVHTYAAGQLPGCVQSVNPGTLSVWAGRQQRGQVQVAGHPADQEAVRHVQVAVTALDRAGILVGRQRAGWAGLRDDRAVRRDRLRPGRCSHEDSRLSTKLPS